MRTWERSEPLNSVPLGWAAWKMVDFAGPQAHSVMLATRAARLASRPLLRSQGAYALPAAVSSVDRFAGVRWKKSKAGELGMRPRRCIRAITLMWGAGGDAGAEIESLEDVVDMDVVEERLQGAVEALKRDLSGLRAGRADASMLDHLEVSAYGSMQPLSAVAQVSVKGPALLVVNAFDPSVRVSPAPPARPAAPGLIPAPNVGNTRR